MEHDPELEAIRAKLRAEFAEAAHAQAPPIDHPIEASDESLPGLVRDHTFLVIDFWAPWCGPCRILGPMVEELAREKAGDVVFAKINVDENPHASQAFQVRSIPTLVVFRNGTIVDRAVGVPSKQGLASMLARHARRGVGAAGPRR